MYTLQQLASKTNTTVIGDASFMISGVADLESAAPGDISFLANPRYRAQMQKSSAGCIVIGKEEVRIEGRNYILSENPTQTFQELITLFCTEVAPRSGFSGIHETAVIHPEAIIEEGVTILPHAVIDAKAHIKRGTFIGSHVYIGPKTVLGTECVIHANVVIREGVCIGNFVTIQPGACIGSCGYGYVQDKAGCHIKLEQVGTVTIEDHVEIGANSTIDRARFKTTRIGAGTKIDNLVQIAHGVCIGRHTLVIAQTGIAGSAKIGNHVVLAGKVAVNGHISIADQVVVAACSGVSKSLDTAGRYAGVPVLPLAQHNKMQVLLRNIETVVKDIKEIRKQIGMKPNELN